MKVAYKKTNLRMRLQSFVAFMWSNCATPEITVKLDLLSHLSGQKASYVMRSLHQFCYLSILWRAENKPEYPLCLGDSVSLAVVAAGWWLCGACHHTSPTWVIHLVGHPAAHDLHHAGALQSWASRSAQVSCGWHPASKLVEPLPEPCNSPPPLQWINQ